MQKTQGATEGSPSWHTAMMQQYLDAVTLKAFRHGAVKTYTTTYLRRSASPAAFTDGHWKGTATAEIRTARHWDPVVDMLEDGAPELERLDVAPAVVATAISIVVDRNIGGAQCRQVLRDFSSTGGSWLTWRTAAPIVSPANSLLERGERLADGGARHGWGRAGL